MFDTMARGFLGSGSGAKDITQMFCLCSKIQDIRRSAPHSTCTPCHPLLLQPGKQSLSGGKLDSFTLLLVQVERGELAGEVLDRFRRRIRKVCAEENVARLCKLVQGRQGDRIGRYGGVKVEGAGLFQNLLCRLADRHGRVRQHAGGTIDDVREVAPSVRQDDFAIGDLAHAAAGEQIHGRATSLVRVVPHGLRQVQVDQVQVNRVGGVDEDDGLAGIEVLPDGRESRVAEIVVVFTVASHQDDSVCLERVKGIVQLLDDQFGVKKRRDRGKVAVANGVIVAELRAELVAFPRKGCLLDGIAENRRSGRGDA